MSSLSGIVRKQLGETPKEFRQTLKDVRRGGADAGFAGFTYYSDTVKFAKKNFAAIMEALREDTFGEATVAELMSKWRSCKGFDPVEIEEVLMTKDTESDCGVAVFNALAWFALEKVASEHDE